jgi:RND family efflux transporter MFP subunit
LREAKIPVQFGLSSEKGFPHQGILDFADNTVDPTTGTIQVRGVIDNAAGLFVPGLFCQVRVPSGDERPAVLVPERAIGTDQGQKYLLAVKSDNTVEYRPVKLGRPHEGLRAIDEGITAKDKVIIDGLQRARPGVTVEPRPAAVTDQGGGGAGKAKPEAAGPGVTAEPRPDAAPDQGGGDAAKAKPEADPGSAK